MLTEKWPQRFFAFQRQKFARNSAGGGDWPPLAESTLKQKERHRGILRVTDAIYRALTIGNPGNVVRRKGVGTVEMGIGGSARHPDSDMTIGKLAEIHHHGTRHIPARTVIYDVQPIASAMQNDAAAGFRTLVRSLPKPRRS